MNIIEALNAVPIQEAWSTPRCRAPRKSARPTLSNRPVQVAIIAPSSTPKTPNIGWVLNAEEAPEDAVSVDGTDEAGGVLKTGDPPHSHSGPRRSPRCGSLPPWTAPAVTYLAADAPDPAQSSLVFAARSL